MKYIIMNHACSWCYFLWLKYITSKVVYFFWWCSKVMFNTWRIKARIHCNQKKRGTYLKELLVARACIVYKWNTLVQIHVYLMTREKLIMYDLFNIHFFNLKIYLIKSCTVSLIKLSILYIVFYLLSRTRRLRKIEKCNRSIFYKIEMYKVFIMQHEVKLMRICNLHRSLRFLDKIR